MGGLLGNTVKSAIFGLYFSFISTESSGYFRNTSLVEAMFFLGMPSAVVMSIIIVSIIRGITLRSERHIGVLGRAILGPLIMSVLLAIILLVTGNVLPVRNSSSWMIASLFYGDFGVIIGAIAGMMAGQRNKMRLR
jgi:hypothetical protein